MDTDPPPPYLLPYLRAAATHGHGFASLLWASPDSQAVRFRALTRLWDLNGLSVLDVGCGRADFLDFLLARGVRPADYVGIEAVAELADEAERKGRAYGRAAAAAGGAAGRAGQAGQAGQAGPGVTIIRADFVREPARMFVGADVVVFSGSLNTTADAPFYATLRRAYEAAAAGLVFNFLDAPTLAGNSYLSWRRRADVLDFARDLSGDAGNAGGDARGNGDRVRMLADYLDGDCSVAVGKSEDGGA